MQSDPHPAADAQATRSGKALSVLAVIDNDIHAGYGDFTANTGPIHVESIPLADPEADWTDHFTMPTEQIGVYRPLTDGRVLVPHTDPQGASTGGYSERDLDGVWHDRSARFAAQHVFDIAEVGARLFACGSEGGNAVVWVSTDGGATWSESLRSPTSDDFERFYALAVIGSSVYVKSAIGETTSKWTAAGGWTATALDLLPDGISGGPGVPWRDGYVLPGDVPFGTEAPPLYYFDGITATQVSAAVRGFSVADDGSLYILEPVRLLRQIAATGPLDATTIGQVEQFGTEAHCSLLIQGDMALVGTNRSRVKAVTLP